MANKAISELPQALNVNNQDLFVLEQSGIAKKLTAETFITEQGIIDALAEALDGHGGIQSVALSSISGRTRTYLITFTDETTTTFQVLDGTSIDRIVKTSTAGLTDTYTVFMSDGTTSFFQVTNGSKGDTGYPTDEQVATAVNTWLDNNVTPGTGAVLDRTLTMSNAAAPADLAGDLKSALDNISDMQATSILDDVTWELGTMGSNGSDSSSWSRIRTVGYVDITGITAINMSLTTTGYKYVYRFFDSSKVQVSVDGAGNWQTTAKTLAVPSGAVYVRFLVSHDPDQNMNDTSISQYFSATAYAPIVTTINKNTSDISELYGADVLSGITWERGTLDEHGADSASTSRARTVGYIDVSNIRAILFKINSGYDYGIYTYDVSYNFITSYVWISDSDIFVIPANVNYIRLLITANPAVWIPDASISSNLRAYDKSDYVGLTGGVDGNTLSFDWFNATAVNKKEIPALESGTTILTLGDSITAANDSTGWTTHFATMTGTTIINKAVGGTTFGESATSDPGHWMSTQISNVSTANWNATNLVIVACGTNDYGNGTPLNELKAKVQSAITAIKANTNVPIVFITPIRRGTSASSDPMQKLPVIAGIISNVALANTCNVIKGFDFPIPTYTTGYVDNMTQDGLHPNATGANVFARSVINALS